MKEIVINILSKMYRRRYAKLKSGDTPLGQKILIGRCPSDKKIKKLMETSLTIEKLIVFYTDWKNSLLTAPNWARMHEITISECVILLNAGMKLSKLPIENIEI